MAGLEPSVHAQLEQYIENNFTANQKIFRTYDTVEALPDMQVRTVIAKAPRGREDGYFICVQSTVDYTKHVHGDPECEMNLQTFHLPANAVKELVMEHIRNLESEVRDLRWQVNPEDWIGGGIELVEEDEEAEAEDEALDEAPKPETEPAVD